VATGHKKGEATMTATLTGVIVTTTLTVTDAER
jgi:hypothetical protein